MRKQHMQGAKKKVDAGESKVNDKDEMVDVLQGEIKEEMHENWELGNTKGNDDENNVNVGVPVWFLIF